MTQTFKGDTLEQQMIDAGDPAFEACIQALNSFFQNCYTSHDFLLMLYDNGRMPFSDRVPRDVFIGFIQEAIPNFPVTGTFEAYLFILKSIFGEETEVQFDVPAAGKLEMLVAAEASLDFNFLASEFSGGVFQEYTMQTTTGDDITFTGISGIDSEAELSALLAELIPVGIWPDITLTFFTLSEFIGEDGSSGVFSIEDSFGNQLVFLEP